MSALETLETLVPHNEFRKSVETASQQSISLCFQCGKCTNGCPITFAMDIMPHGLIHLLQLGQVEDVLRCETIWVCASCETCTTRCPNGIDIAHVMDTLRQLSRPQATTPARHRVPVFHSAFLESVKKHGRLYETEMALAYSIRVGGWLELLKLTGYGYIMALKGKIELLPHRIRGIKQVRELFRKVEAA